jgi:hypothetical protein
MPGVRDDAAGLRAANARLRDLLAERDAQVAELQALVAERGSNCMSTALSTMAV